jgi:hypothetical protein
VEDGSRKRQRNGCDGVGGGCLFSTRSNHCAVPYMWRRWKATEVIAVEP